MNVVVTGASGGIGGACVAAFRDQGAHVIGVDLEDSSSADEHLTIDLSSPECGGSLLRAVGDRDVWALVNNAAFVEYSAALDTDTAIWDRTMAVNLRAPFLLAKALYPNLVAGDGSVVNVSSVHALATSPSIVAYAASKGGLASLTRALALEWAPEVRVNSVLPGAIDTGMLADGLFRSDQTISDLGGRHPMGRVGSPTDIADAVVFLVRSSFITGSSLVVDGGATARLSIE